MIPLGHMAVPTMIFLLFSVCGFTSEGLLPLFGEKEPIDQFKDLIEAGQGAEYRAEYRISYNIEGESGSDTFEIVQQGERSRMDIAMDLGLGRGPEQISIYSLADEAYMCTRQYEVACVKISQEGFNEFDLVSELEKNPEDYEIERLDERTVQRITAKCFSVAGGEIEGDVEVCYSEGGVMLYFELEQGRDRTTIEATSVKIGNVDDDEFELPEGAQIYEGDEYVPGVT